MQSSNPKMTKRKKLALSSGVSAVLIALIVWIEEFVDLLGRLVIILSTILGAGCGATLPAVDNEKQIEFCEAACENLEKMECDFAPPDCLAFCKDVKTDVAFPPFNAVCVSEAKTCEEAGGCQ